MVEGCESMQYHIHPHIGNWYQSTEFPEVFEVVALEGGHEELIEIQFFNGDIEEVDKETWTHLHLFEIAPPEDWSGAFEVAKEEMSQYVDEPYRPESWDNPINTIEPD